MPTFVARGPVRGEEPDDDFPNGRGVVILDWGNGQINLYSEPPSTSVFLDRFWTEALINNLCWAMYSIWPDEVPADIEERGKIACADHMRWGAYGPSFDPDAADSPPGYPGADADPYERMEWARKVKQERNA